MVNGRRVGGPFLLFVGPGSAGSQWEIQVNEPRSSLNRHDPLKPSLQTTQHRSEEIQIPVDMILKPTLLEPIKTSYDSISDSIALCIIATTLLL